MRTVISAAPGYYLAKTAADGSDRASDIVLEPIVAWEIEEGFFPWPVTRNQPYYETHVPWEITKRQAIVLPDGHVVANCGDTTYNTLEDWRLELAEEEEELQRRLAANGMRKAEESEA